MYLSHDQLAAIAAVLRTGSFDAAADELGVTQSAISQRVRQLEDRLGVVLIRRGQPSTGTEAGLRLSRLAEDIALLEGQALSDLGIQSAVTRRVTLGVNADSLGTWFVPVLAAFGDLLFDIVVEDQDHCAELLRQGQVTAAVTDAESAVATCQRQELGALRYLATASPEFAARWFRDGATPDALSRAPCLIYSPKDELQARWVQNRTGHRAEVPTITLPSTHGFVDAVLAGAGWGMNPEGLVRDHLAAGRLVTLTPNPELDVPLAWQVSRAVAPALAHLTRAVQEAAAYGLRQVELAK